MTKLEREIETRLCRMVRNHGGMCLKWVCPGWSGVPDRIIVLPGGRVIFAETKRPSGGRLSSLQKWWLDKLTEMGFFSCVVWNDTHIDTLELVIIDMLSR